MEKEIGLLKDIIDEQEDLEENDTGGFDLGVPLGRKLGRRNLTQKSSLNKIIENSLGLFKDISIEDEY